jgi:hypothetical protein
LADAAVIIQRPPNEATGDVKPALSEIRKKSDSEEWIML